MNLIQLLLIFKARRKVIIWVFLSIVTSTVVLNLIWPKSYDATTTLLLNYKGVDPVTGTILPAQLMPGYIATQVDILQSQDVALRVVRALGLAKSADVQKNFNEDTGGKGNIEYWLADVLQRKLTIAPSPVSSVIDITYSNNEPNFAALIANAFADAYIEKNLQLKTQPSQKAAIYFASQIKIFRDNLEAAQNKLSSYQQDKGMTSVDDRLDVESTKLNEMTSQLSLAQSQLIDASSRQNSALNNPITSPDVANSPIVQSLKIDAAHSESKLAQLSQTVSKNHPEYKAAEFELAKIKSQLSDEIAKATNNLMASAKINQERVSQLKQGIAIQKQKVLELNHMRGEMNNLQKDVLTAQNALDTVSQKLNQTSIEGQSNQGDFAILNPAIAPTKYAKPRVLINVFFSILAGGFLGLLLALIQELMDRRVRNETDVNELTALPVLATITGLKSQSTKKSRLFMRPNFNK